jgi:anthranilate 1,2-dioxygenase ferredoxin component
MAWHDIGALAAFEEDAVAAVAVAGVPLAVFRAGDEVFALHDQCSHGYARLSDGYVEDGCVECPLHQAMIDFRTGEPKSPPVTEAIRTYAVRVVGDRVEVEVGA